MKGDAIAATEEVGSEDFGVLKMELHTDDEKVRASIAKDATPMSLKMASMALPPTSKPSEDLVKAAEHSLENGLEHGDGELVPPAESGRQLMSSNTLEQQPLSEEALQKSGVFLPMDIPMIDDDDDDDEGTPIDDVVPDTSSYAKNSLNPQSHSSTSSGDAVKSTDNKPSSASSIDIASKDVKADNPSIPDDGSAAHAAVPTDFRPAPAAPLKSALKKSRSKAKKGHRVTFHDSRIFYIDTEAETTAEPQLLTVRSLELPMASADYKVFIPNYEFLSSLPRRSYTYEDAIVSLYQRDDVHAEAPAPPPSVCNGEAAANEPLEATATEDKTVPEVVATEEPSASPPPPLETALDAPLDNAQAIETVQCLTEANLRQHEILMERDDGVATEEPAVPATVTSTAAPSGVVAPIPAVKNLSPPLKELSVDVSVAAASWQVELSPLNSIPESETDDSSASSQDTIIMMTSEESRRNEEHIRESTKSYQQQSGKGTEQQELGGNNNNNNGDAASTVSSQDSDETLKCDESVDPGYVPPWTKGTAATLLMDGGISRDQQLTLSQRTNSQIRQLMERNAVRRSLLRYSNTRKRTPQEDAPVAAIDKQRQWRSHESLLDTIKQLTVDDEEDDDDEDDGDYEEIRIHNDDNHLPTYVSNGYHGHPYSNGEKTASNLSLQDVQRLIASPSSAQSVDDRRRQEKMASNLSLQDVQRLISSPPSALHRRLSQSTTNVDVPGDVRQWKIQAGRWDEARRRNQQHLLQGSNGHDGDQTPPSPGGDETGDELAQFVQRDSGRIERLRKRYSYSDSGDYESIGAFARRSSVRGIKPRFGSTSEILKQMQSQLQPSPLANGRGHMTWPYPLTSNENDNNRQMRIVNGDVTNPSSTFNNNNRHTMTIRTTVTSRSTNSLPSLKEEIYGILGAHRASYSGDARGNPSAIYAPLPGRNHVAPPPPYQPPPPAPHHHHHHHHHHHQAAPPPQRAYSKDERGVPEGASGSPKAAFDSIYGRTASAPSQQQQQQPSLVNANRHQVPTMADNSGVVYYVMQV